MRHYLVLYHILNLFNGGRAVHFFAGHFNRFRNTHNLHLCHSYFFINRVVCFCYCRNDFRYIKRYLRTVPFYYLHYTHSFLFSTVFCFATPYFRKKYTQKFYHRPCFFASPAKCSIKVLPAVFPAVMRKNFYWQYIILSFAKVRHLMKKRRTITII